MEKIQCIDDISNIKENTIMNDKFLMTNSTIIFNGTNNKIFIEDNAKIVNSTINFNGNNAECYISNSKSNISIYVMINNNCKFFLGKNCAFNNKLTIILSEMKNCIIGNNCLFSFGIWIRNADAHLIYDCMSKKRINHSKSVLIGDHVWIGQNALILKNSIIGSGSIIGGSSVVSSKKIPSNSIWAGNPAKLVREKCFWSGYCVHTWTEEQTKEFECMDTKEYDFTLSPSEIKNNFDIDSMDIFNMPKDKYRFSI